MQNVRVELDDILIEYLILPLRLEPSDQARLIIATLHLGSDVGDYVLQLGVLISRVVRERHQLIMRTSRGTPIRLRMGL